MVFTYTYLTEDLYSTCESRLKTLTKEVKNIVRDISNIDSQLRRLGLDRSKTKVKLLSKGDKRKTKRDWRETKVASDSSLVAFETDCQKKLYSLINRHHNLQVEKIAKNLKLTNANKDFEACKIKLSNLIKQISNALKSFNNKGEDRQTTSSLSTNREFYWPDCEEKVKALTTSRAGLIKSKQS